MDIRKRKKCGPLKSSPGFLKCMRSVYLFFKEEKEKGALNIPINSFIERTAVACGVGRKTLYNYAKKGLFDKNPTLLQSKKKFKKLKSSLEPSPIKLPAREPPLSGIETILVLPPKKKGRSVGIQTAKPPIYVSSSSNIAACLENSGATTLIGVKGDAMGKGEVSGPWAGGNSARHDIDYFTKTNIWQNVYSINTAEMASSNIELHPTRMGNCQPTASDLSEL